MVFLMFFAYKCLVPALLRAALFNIIQSCPKTLLLYI